MKKISIIIYSFLVLVFISSCASQKETAANQQKIAQLLKENRFKFIAQQARPQRINLNPSQLQLDNSYQLVVTKDSINCYLPYFGVATQAPIGNTQNGIQFISTKFSYQKTVSAKGDYLITIIPQGEHQTNQLNLQISKDGWATLNVYSNYRDRISFDGVVVSK